MPKKVAIEYPLNFKLPTYLSINIQEGCQYKRKLRLKKITGIDRMKGIPSQPPQLGLEIIIDMKFCIKTKTFKLLEL